MKYFNLAKLFNLVRLGKISRTIIFDMAAVIVSPLWMPFIFDVMTNPGERPWILRHRLAIYSVGALISPPIAFVCMLFSERLSDGSGIPDTLPCKFVLGGTT